MLQEYVRYEFCALTDGWQKLCDKYDASPAPKPREQLQRLRSVLQPVHCGRDRKHNRYWLLPAHRCLDADFLTDYVADIKARWAVHQHGFNLFVEDVKKGYDFILPFCKRSIDYTVSVYRRFRPVPAQ